MIQNILLNKNQIIQQSSKINVDNNKKFVLKGQFYKINQKLKYFYKDERNNQTKVSTSQRQYKSSTKVLKSQQQNNLHSQKCKTFNQIKNSSSDFNQTQIFDYKKIQQCKSTIQSIVQRITIENKKNSLIKNLIQIINLQMVSVKQEEKKSEQEQFFQQSKVIKKLNYDIDKVLQKHNEEIANLFRLKDQINAKRSERVVFSNLFRKIQTQLKNATNFYTETILKSQTTKDQTLSLKLKPDFSLQYTTMRQGNKYKESQQPSEQRGRDLKTRRDSQIHNYMESSHIKKRKFKPQKGGGSRFITQHPDNYDHSETIQKRTSYINNKLYQFQFQMKRLFQATGCQDFQEVQAFVHNVQSQNDMLQKQLEKMTTHAQEVEFEQLLIVNQRKNAEIVQQSALPKSRGRLRNAKSLKQISTESQTTQPMLTNHETVEQILQIFNLKDESVDKFAENVSKMDQKLDLLLKNVYISNNFVEQQQSLQKQTHGSTSSSDKHSLPPLNVILDKIQPIGESEKLYQKSWFLDAYQKQLKKFNKKQNKKK